ncbi:TfpX/TfpZ family type IV pilin accessory protein [Acinetobacter haemolyticus]|uniref:TfpX/TfpZ family type IV pilin accessory protein n=1 Tax=Acinetobacter haemolyticus TaxID=29430 RepID=UPI003D1D4E18
MSKRIKFFISHLAISFFIALIFIGVVFLLWYPSPLAKAVGVTSVFFMLVFIDVIIGPLLSFFVYKEGKRTLIMDLTFIIIMQASALAYGVYSIAQGRPAWIVYYYDQFELVTNKDLVKDRLQLVKPEYQTYFEFNTKVVAVQPRKTDEETKKDMIEVLTTGIPVFMRPERYVPFEQESSTILKSSYNLDKLKKFNEPHKVDEILAKYPQANVWLPLNATEKNMTVLINKEKGEVVKIVDLRPWK